MDVMCKLQGMLLVLLSTLQKFYKRLFYVNFDEEQLLFQTFLPKMFSTRDICEKLNFAIFNAPVGDEVPPESLWTL